MDTASTVAIVVAVGELVALCFMTPMVSKVNKLFEIINDMDKKLYTPEEIDKAIDLKIYSHMSRCHAHNVHHRIVNSQNHE